MTTTRPRRPLNRGALITAVVIATALVLVVVAWPPILIVFFVLWALAVGVGAVLRAFGLGAIRLGVFRWRR